MRPWVALLFAVSLLSSCEAQGSSAVTTAFVKKGDDLILNADVPDEFLLVEWTFNKMVNVVRFAPGGKRSVHPGFTGRVEFPVKKFSVKLKNLQETDSGVYAARVFTLQEDKPLAEYNVTVQGPVSPVELTVDSVDSRCSDSCNLTVTCSTQHSHISSTFRCVNRTCSQEGGERSELTTSGASLHVYLLNSLIICNHSNHVNWTQDFKRIEPFCPQCADRDPDPVHVYVIAVITILIYAGLIDAGLFLVEREETIKERSSRIRFEVPQAQSLEQSNRSSGLSPTSTYSLVGPHAGSLIPTQTLPESLYAQVEKPARSFNS